MRLITSEELYAVGGGGTDETDDNKKTKASNDTSTVRVVGTKQQVEDAKNEATLQNLAIPIGAAAGFATSLIVTGTCTAGLAAATGPFAPETIAAVTPGCRWLGGVVGAPVGAATTAMIKNSSL